MNENKLFVDNPLELTGLFSSGIYLAAEKRGAALEYTGVGAEGVLHIIDYPEFKVIAPSLLKLLEKIMSAVIFNKKSLTPSDYAVINAGILPDGKNIKDIIEDFKPIKTIYWGDTWMDDSREIPFYKTANVYQTEILRCHSVQTVMDDLDRKKACWTAIRSYFGM